MWIAVDDTDSLDGMCTTFLVNRLIEEFSEFDVIGRPRLVRLNPTVPWKTRGNGAVAIRFGRGRGTPEPVAYLGGQAVSSFPEGGPAAIGTGEAMERAGSVVERFARVEAPETNPGIAASPGRPHDTHYWRAVRGIVTVPEGRALATAEGVEVRGYKNGRGIIGALAALAWHGRASAHELIAYRERDRWGTPRRVNRASVMGTATRIPTTFDNYDFENDDMTMVPSTPCPVLFGLRGTDAGALVGGAAMVTGESAAEWTLFATNHGSDDHIVEKRIAEVARHESVAVGGRVATLPSPRRGGHVFFELEDGPDRIPVAAFEPTRSFRERVLALRPGDTLRAYGSVSTDPAPCINLEKFELRELAASIEKVENPVCPACGKHMKSAGRGAGFRCARCGERSAIEGARFEAPTRAISPGWYEVPTCARRHLARPLRLMGIEPPLPESVVPPGGSS